LEILFGSTSNIYQNTPILCCTPGVGGGSSGVQEHPKSKLKIRVKSFKIQSNFVEIWAQYLKTFTQSLKI